VALLLPAVQSARETARGNTCRNSMKQLMTALTNMDVQQNRLPGYINAVVDPTSPKTGMPPDFSRGRRASWVVMCFPYMELNSVWDRWSQDFTTEPADLPDGGRGTFTPPVEYLTCPSDSPETVGEPWLSYIGNAGWAFSDSDRTGGTVNRENVANGVFFDNSKNKSILSSASVQDGREDHPEIRTSLNYISANDGNSKTLLLSESVHTWFYAYDGGTADFELGFDATTDLSAIRDTKHVFGFVWKNVPVGVERINGDKNYDKIPPAAIPTAMAGFAALGHESYGFPSSNHPNGINVAFCGGQVQFMADSVEPRVYAQLMTSNRNRSNLIIGSVQERQAAEPSDDQY